MTRLQKSEDIDGRCNCLALRQASRYLTALYDQALSEAGLRATQFSILYRLFKDGPIPIGNLAAQMAMDRTTLATNLKPMERDGLLTIQPSQLDRRAKVVEITPSGTQLYRKAFPLWAAVQARFEDAYGEGAAQGLRKAAKAVLRSGFDPWAEASGTMS